MNDKELKQYLKQCLQQETELDKLHNKEDIKKLGNAKLEETVRLCVEIMREQELTKKLQEEPRIGFARYLSDIFRFEGVAIFGLQAITLFIMCVVIYTVAGNPSYIPAFMPLFVLAILPAMFKCQYYGMSELEAVTRGFKFPDCIGKADFSRSCESCMHDIFYFFEAYLQNSFREIGKIILYCMVPYLVCMVSMLRLIRLRRKENMQICTVIILSSCVCWGLLARTVPWLYDTSAFGIWIVAFLFFAAFFIKEIHFIITIRKEGKMYGIIT